MPFCPNPDCPRRKTTGKPAEFLEGVTRCPDCGSLLIEEVAEKPAKRKFTLSDFQKRVLFTLALVLLSRVLVLIPAPGINLQALARIARAPGYDLNFSALYLFSAFALSIMPYLSAYMLVEILSLFTPPLKTWRAEGCAGRTKLKKVGLVATFLFAFMWGYVLAQQLEGMVGTVGDKIVRDPELSFRLIFALTLAAGTFVMIWIAELITSKGIGQGVSILIFAGYGTSIFSTFSGIKIVSHEHSPFEYFLLFALLAIALIALIVVMEKSHRKISVKFKDGIEAHIPLKITSAGTTPVEWTSLLVMAPLTIYGLVDKPTSQKLLLALFPPNIWYFIAYSIGIIFLYYFFTSLFYNPKKMVTFLKNRQASIVSPSGIKEKIYINKSLEVMIPIGVLYLGLVVFAPHLTSIFIPFFSFYSGGIGGIGLIIAVAILLDLLEEMRVRRKGGSLVKVAELHDIPMAGLLKSIFEKKGLPCFLRGYYHRSLLYFFGPYIEISVLVPEGKVAEAGAVIKKYLDPNILMVNLKT